MAITFPEPVGGMFGSSGLESGALTNFYGGPGTGKTNLCLLAVLECVKNKGKAVYIDTEGGFSVERLQQICKGNDIDFDSAVKNIEIVEPKTFEEQRKCIQQLQEKNADLIIVDSIVSLYRLGNDPEKGRQSREELLEANRELSRQLSVLSNMARQRKIPVIMTAHTFKNWETGENEMIGGDVLKYWSKAIIFLEKTEKLSERKATITKHRFMEEGKEAKFVIVEKGIEPSKFKIF